VTEQELLKELGDVDEQYIEEAAPGRRKRFPMMAAGTFAAAAVLALALLPRLQMGAKAPVAVYSEQRPGTEAAAGAAAAPNAAGAAKERAADAAAEAPEMRAAASEECVQLPDPFTDCGTLAEAEQLAGFSLLLPPALPAYAAISYRAIPDELIEVIYSDAEGKEGYRIRKGRGSEDVSGDYNEYGTVRELSQDGRQLTLRGEEGRSYVAGWTDGAHSFALTTEMAELSEQELLSLITQIR